MAIAKKDWKFMEQVAAHFKSTIDPETMPEGSIRDTAKKFNLTRTKVQKILVTTGDYSTLQTRRVQELRDSGMSVKAIAAALDISEATVSSSLPYTSVFHGTADPSGHTQAVRDYRAYEKAQKNRTEVLKGEPKGGPDDLKRSQDGLKGADTLPDWKAEWKKDKAMSYKTEFTRPPRITWENLGDYMPDDKYQELNAHLEAKRKRSAAAREELEQLRALPESDKTPEQKEREEELIDDLGVYPGALNFRNERDLEELSGERLPFEPREIMRLHLEISDWLDEDDMVTLHKYGNMKGQTISRDIVVPADIPLYALHYAIQRAFGWQNSHLHMFNLTDERLMELCENSAVQWQKMVGIMFRSPRMDEDAQFWADDYETGSFRNWLRKKYTGPYISQCKEEGLYSSFYDVQDITGDTEMYVGYRKIPKAKAIYGSPADMSNPSEYYEIPYFAGWAADWDKNGMPGNQDRVELVKFKDYPLDRLFSVFGSEPFSLLERLPLNSVLCPGFDRLPTTDSASSLDHRENGSDVDNGGGGGESGAEDETQYFEENTCKTVTEELSFIKEAIDAAFRLNEDSPVNQVLPMPFATELIYSYDFGDSWKVRITGSFDCRDLAEAGTVDQETLDKANIKCRETYRPVLIARDGDMVMDDVGNLSGFAGFLREINPELEDMDKYERTAAREQKKETLEWAKGQGWKRNDASDFNLM